MTNNYQVLLSMIFTLSQLLLIAIARIDERESFIDERESFIDELANDLALKEHQLNQMRYHVEESNVLGSWQRKNSWDSNSRF